MLHPHEIVHDSSPAASRRRRPTRLADDGGWILAPAIILMTVVLALGFALLAVVDRQTSEARAKRTTDAAQALSDGVASSAAKALASFDTLSSAGLATAFPTIGACQVVRGDLVGGQEAATPAETAQDAVARNVRNAVKRHFDETDNEYRRVNGAATKWSVNICPDRTDGSDVWSDAYLPPATVTTPSNAPRRAVWVRAQADVRATAGTSATSRQSRATAVKVRQANAPFVAPEDLAIGAASFSTDLGTSVTGLLQDGVVGKLVLQGLLGQTKLVENGNAKIGLRCGLLDVLDNPGLDTCLSGTLGSVNTVLGGTTDMLNLGQLGNALGGFLGTNRTVNLSDYAIAPDRARAAFKALALNSGTFVKAVGGGRAGTPGAETPCFASSTTNEAGTSAGVGTLTAANTADKVVYIEQVGDGGVSNVAKNDPFCTLPAGISPAVLVIERGGARVTDPRPAAQRTTPAFTGVLYAANRQEVDGATGEAAIAAKRKSARLRETIRIEEPGKVSGAVWTDGAGGQAGLYPVVSQPSKAALLNVGGTQGVCSLPVVGSLLTEVGDLLTGVAGLVGTVLTNVVDTVVGKRTQTETRYPNGAPANPSGCDLFKATLGSLTDSQLLSLFGSGGTVEVVVTEQRVRTQSLDRLNRPITCGILAILTAPASCWLPNDANTGFSAWTAKEKTSETFGTGLLSDLNALTLPNVLNQLLGTLSSTLSSWTAVDRNIDRIRLANVGMAVGTENVPGTYRSIPPLASLVQGGA